MFNQNFVFKTEPKMRLCMLIFLSFAILVTTAMVGADDDLNGTYNINITKRFIDIFPPIQNYNKALTKQGSGKGYPVVVARHRIIPEYFLKDFYNKLLNNKEANKLQFFWTKFNAQFKQFYRQKAVNEGDSYKYDTTIANVNKFVSGLLGNKVVHDENAEIPENFDEFQAYYLWLPGNLFVCPRGWNNFHYDTKLDFENLGKIIESGRFDNLKAVYDMMQLYIDDKEVDFDKLDRGLTEILNFLDAQPLKSSDWKSGEYEKYYIIEGTMDKLKKYVCQFFGAIASPFLSCRRR